MSLLSRVFALGFLLFLLLAVNIEYFCCFGSGFCSGLGLLIIGVCRGGVLGTAHFLSMQDFSPQGRLSVQQQTLVDLQTVDLAVRLVLALGDFHVQLHAHAFAQSMGERESF